MADTHQVLVERLYDAFNRHYIAVMTEICDERMEFRAVTAEELGREPRYVGPDGPREYLRDGSKAAPRRRPPYAGRWSP